MVLVWIQIFETKQCQKNSTTQLFINNNARFCYQSKEKYCPQTLMEECKYEQKNVKIENLIDDDLEESLSDSGTENDYNDEMESDDESNK